MNPALFRESRSRIVAWDSRPGVLAAVPAMIDVIVLNGGSSSGKSSLARSLQELLVEPWIALGVMVEEGLLDGGTGHRRVADALAGLSVLWVGVRRDPVVAASPDRHGPHHGVRGRRTSSAPTGRVNLCGTRRRGCRFRR